VGREDLSVGSSYTEGLSEGGKEEMRVTEGGQVYVDHPIGETTNKLGGDFEGKARFTHPWWPEEGDEAHFEP
jgi:hypothetical protein